MIGDPAMNSGEEGFQEDPMPRRAGRREIVNAVVLSLGFMFIFFGFSVCQNSATTNDFDVGLTSLGILYATFSATNLVSATIVASAGIKMSLVIASIPYTLFCLANLVYSGYVAYPSAGLVGASAAILWTAQGAYITMCAQRYEIAVGLPANTSIGYFQGLFFSIYQASMFLGNLSAFFIYYWSAKSPRSSVFVTMAVATLTGSICIALLRRERGQTMQAFLGDSYLIAESNEGSQDGTVYSVSRLEGWSESSGSHRPSFHQHLVNPVEDGSRTPGATPRATPKKQRQAPAREGDSKYRGRRSAGGSRKVSTGGGDVVVGDLWRSPGDPRRIPEESYTPAESRGNESINSEARVAPARQLESVSTLRLLYQSRDIKMLIWVALYSGLSHAFLIAQYPLLKSDRKMGYLGLSMCGLANMIGSHLFGWVSDRSPRSIVIGFGLLFHTFVYIALWSHASHQNDTVHLAVGDAVYIAVGVAFGLGDAVFNTQAYAVISTIFERSAEPGFANYKMFQALSTAVACLGHLRLKTWNVKLAVLVALLIIAFAVLVQKARALSAAQGTNQRTPYGFGVRDFSSREGLLSESMAQDRGDGATANGEADGDAKARGAEA